MASKPSKKLKKLPDVSKKQEKTKPVEPAPVPETPTEQDVDESESDGTDNDVDEEGMQRLMKLLGDGELDDIAQFQLGLLGAENSGEDSDDNDYSDKSNSDDESSENESDNGSADHNGSEPSGEGEDGDVEQVDLEDISSVDEDVVPQQKIVINNTSALNRIRELFQLDPTLPWTETLATSYPEPIDVDVNDDLKREVAFYKQALYSAEAARTLAAKHKLPFTRPADFYAEMVKSDSHMERIRQRLLDEGATIKRSEDKRKERDGKKFGKKVQLEKMKEREKSKKDMEERIRGLKRKRKDALDGDGDDFDVKLEDAISDRPAKRHAGSKGGKPVMSRGKRDAKFGFGAKGGRRGKQNTKESTDSFGAGSKGKPTKFGGGSKKKMGTRRLGKSKRDASRGK